ncbi:MAG: carboxy terminal-processing peptidase [Pseudomonadota bacterium]
MPLSKHPIYLIIAAVVVIIVAGLVGMFLGSLRGEEQVDTERYSFLDRERYQRTTLEILQRLGDKHLITVSKDNDFSKKMLDRFLTMLDPNRAFFLAEDATQFSPYERTLDNLLRKGVNTAPFNIYLRFRKRLEDRLQGIIAQLENPLTTFDFAIEESLEINNPKWHPNTEAADDYWRKRIKLELLNQKLSGQSTAVARQQLAKRYRRQLENAQEITLDEIYELYINSVTAQYDPHTRYSSPKKAKKTNIQRSLSLQGIGAVLQENGDYIEIARLVPGGPAYLQGDLQAADLITAIGQGEDGALVNVIGWRLDDVIDLVRGEKGSTVRLEVIPTHSMDDTTTVISIVRDQVKLADQAAQKAMMNVNVDGNEYKIGIIDIPAFYIDFAAFKREEPDYRSSTRDASRLLNELIEEGIDGLIIDLRDNGGGSVREVTSLADLFIDRGPVVQIASSKSISETRAREQGIVYDGPLIVMVNRLSASASEIFSGLVQDYKRGVVVGSPSYGKGTIQVITPLDNPGQIKITTAMFYRVSGTSTQHRGVIPDILFPDTINEHKVGEQTQDNALPWTEISPANFTSYGVDQALINTLAEKSQQRIASLPKEDLTDAIASLPKEDLDNAIAALPKEDLDNAIAALPKEDLDNAIADIEQENLDDAIARGIEQ